jgi:putative heme iron utilization protein
MKIDFDSVVHLLHESRYGSLATQSIQMPGYPFASVLPFVLDENAHPVFLISQLAEHTKNLTIDYRASFIVHDCGTQNVLTTERISLMGDVRQFDASAELVARYLRYQPDAEQYLGLGDFAFFRLKPKGARYVAGFGRMGWIDEAEWASSVVLSSVDEEKLVHSLIEAQPAEVKLLGLDCYGFDFERTGMRERQRFPNGPLATDKIRETVKRILSTV